MRRRHGGAKRAGERGPTFVQEFHYIMETAAWRDLDCVARSVYLEIKRHYSGSNNGRIGLSCRQAADAIGMSPASASRAFQTLIEHGFIVEVVKGVPARGSGFNKATEWLLEEYRDDRAGRPPSKSFMSWSKNRIPVSNTANCVSPMQRDGIQIPLGPRPRFTHATSKPVLADPTLHPRNTLTSSHRQVAVGSAAPVASEPSQASARRRGQAATPDVSLPVPPPADFRHLGDEALAVLARARGNG